MALAAIMMPTPANVGRSIAVRPKISDATSNATRDNPIARPQIRLRWILVRCATLASSDQSFCATLLFGQTERSQSAVTCSMKSMISRATFVSFVPSMPRCDSWL